MYTPLPKHLLPFVISNLYFPYFGSIQSATYATFGINCGSPEANFDSLATQGQGWDVTMSVEETDKLICNPALVKRQQFYFKYGHPETPKGLGCSRPTGFWSFFNCAGPPATNPIHREHYFDGNLFHLDVVPWATIMPWSRVQNNVQNELKKLALPVFLKMCEAAANLHTIFVRGRTAAMFLTSLNLGFELEWHNFIPGYSFANGKLKLRSGREIRIRAVNQFNHINHAAANPLIDRA